MKVDKIRIGFATNSSSSHSMIVLPKGAPMPSGAKTAEEKDSYLKGIVGDIFGLWDEELHGKMAEFVSEDLAGHKGVEHSDGDWYYGLPFDWLERGPCWPYLSDFRAYLQREDVALFVWDRDYDHPASSLEGAGDSEPFWVLEKLDGRGATSRDPDTRYVARKDGNWWTLFSRKTGLKIRMSFDEDAVPLVKAEVPELVDVKITDYCPIGCHFCYQGSTKDGLHASFGSVENLAKSMSEMKVFEVAIGGGEPTMHPQFVAVLQAFHARGVIPNFTTRSMAWFRDEGVVHAVRAFCGGFAFSVDERGQAERVLDSVPSELKKKLVFHHVMGSVSKDKFENLMSFVADQDIPITLLGYKTTGRGGEFEPVEYLSWFEDKSVFSPRRVSIDTALAAQVKPHLEAMGVPDWCYHLAEGKTSMYVDCVKRSVAPSSFCGPEHEQKLEKLDMVSVRAGWETIEPLVVT